jgi:hypothetical protein
MQVRSVVYVGVAALLAGLAGCASKPIDGPVTKVSDLVALCGGQRYTTAALFGGAPPHPILVVPPQGAVEDMLANPRFRELGAAWNPPIPRSSSWWRAPKVKAAAWIRV